MDLKQLDTEQRNENSQSLDQLSSYEIVSLINREDQRVAEAITPCLPQIAALTEEVVQAFETGHRLFYLGAGTSGRLGVLDASECVPTFGVDPHLVTGLIAGGDHALRHPVEGAEDDLKAGARDLHEAGLRTGDVVIGLAASGRTPYVLGGLHAARALRCVTGAIACTRHSRIGEAADYAIEVVVGPEVLTGSTRMKAGTAQKMVLNMISTTAMVRIGKVYENLMIDVIPSNEKLRARACAILQTLTGFSAAEALETLQAAQWDVKTAVVMALRGCNAQAAAEKLAQAHGHVRQALANHSEASE